MQNLNNLFIKLNMAAFDIQKQAYLYCKELSISNNKVYRFDDILLSFSDVERLNILQPDAVYCFNKEPFILFYDFTKSVNDDRMKDFEQKAWNYDKAPIIVALFTNETKVYNAFAYNKDSETLESEAWSEDKAKLLSQLSIASGKCWENWTKERIAKAEKRKKFRANKVLFDNIKHIQNQLINKGLQDKNAVIILLRLLFLRYLIDRKVAIFGIDAKASEIAKKRQLFSVLILNQDSLQSVFTWANEKFNGILFKDVIELSNDQLKLLSVMFSATVYEDGTAQREIRSDTDISFDAFHFDIIPVETIGGIYETVLNKRRKETAAFYTPSFLVDYILKQTLQPFIEKSATAEAKVLDPSCGSGIFLVQAFRRMVHTEELRIGSRLTQERLCAIAKNNLFGIDVEINALNVAAFSIYIAILDFLQPVEIDRLAKNFLPTLKGTNLFRNDFFNEETPVLFKDEHGENYDTYNEVLNAKKGNTQLDFIIGNPPWQVNKTLNTGDDGDAKRRNFHNEYVERHKIIISQHQIAQSFLYRTQNFAKEGHTQCALIITGSAIHSDGADKFKQIFFKKAQINAVLDLSALYDKVVFEDVMNPSAVVFYEFPLLREVAESHILKYTAIKGNLLTKSLHTLIIEAQDFEKPILQSHFIDYKWMFKVALYGSSADFHFLRRLTANTYKIQDFIEKKDNDGNDVFLYGDGIKRQTIGSMSKKPEKDYFYFEKIKDIPIIEKENLFPFYAVINTTNLPTEKDLWVKSGGNINLYSGGHRLLVSSTPKNKTKLRVCYISKDAVFREKTLGIITKNTDDLKILYAIMNSKLFAYFQYMTAGSWGTNMPEILQKEYLAFPYKDLLDSENIIKSVNIILKDFEDGKKLNIDAYNKINEIINVTYSVNVFEEQLIDYVEKIAIHQFRSSPNFLNPLYSFNPAHKKQVITDYVAVYHDRFKAIFEGNNEYFTAKVYEMEYFTAVHFIAAKQAPEKYLTWAEPNEMTSEQQVFKLFSDSLSLWELTEDIFIQKDVKGFDDSGSNFYIVKPNEYKSWHPAIAHLDAAAFENEILNADLDQMNSAGGADGNG